MTVKEHNLPSLNASQLEFHEVLSGANHEVDSIYIYGNLKLKIRITSYTNCVSVVVDKHSRQYYKIGKQYEQLTREIGVMTKDIKNPPLNPVKRFS
jgi:hypothetical protein